MKEESYSKMITKGGQQKRKSCWFNGSSFFNSDLSINVLIYLWHTACGWFGSPKKGGMPYVSL